AGRLVGAIQLQLGAGPERQLAGALRRRRRQRFRQSADPRVEQRRDALALLWRARQLLQAADRHPPHLRALLRHHQEAGPERVALEVEAEAALAGADAEEVRALADRGTLFERDGEDQQAAFDDVVDRVRVVEQERAVRADLDRLAFLL